MLHVDITLEDTRLIADWRQDGNWDATITDNVSGERRDFTWTPNQIAAVVALGIAGDECDLAPIAYPIAEPLFANIPKALRFIP